MLAAGLAVEEGRGAGDLAAVAGGHHDGWVRGVAMGGVGEAGGEGGVGGVGEGREGEGVVEVADFAVGVCGHLGRCERHRGLVFSV